ncbi:MAG TPA: hypothetical protein VFX21_00400 [Acidimicrobiia bacterium]|nr:hypothetical protein [Acidimicrobiia bacterium]
MTKAADVRAELGHSVVDADGHHIEYLPDARAVLPEAFELLERGRVDAAQFRAFTCDNARRCWGDTVFTGTAAEFG